MDAFDFILHLHPDKVPRHRQALNPHIKALSTRPASTVTIRPGFDPVILFTDRIQSAAGDAIVLFYDANGGLAICGLFNPTLANKEREFRIAIDYISKPAHASGKPQDRPKAKAQVLLDRASLLRQFVEMSEGLVAKVTTKEML